MKINIILMNGNKESIEIKNKNMRINDLINNIYDRFLILNYSNKNNYNFYLNYKGTNLINKLSDYRIIDNSDIHLNIKSKSQTIQKRNSIVDDYIISPFSSSLSNSLEKESNIDINYLISKIKNIENELDDIKEYINNIN